MTHTKRALRTRVAAASATAFASLIGPSLPAAGATTDVVDVPISFTVTNANHTLAPCPTDGKQYTVRGHLTGPASKLASTSRPAGTLYLHGLEVSEWFWRLPAIGSGFATTMARLGHVSVTIDRIGYPTSGHPNGNSSCAAGHADMAHQIVQKLRSGAYTGTRHPRFGKVALAGHSLGGAIAEIEAYSFKDVDALALLSYADLALTPSVLATSMTWGRQCLTGGATSGGAPGYAYLTTSVADYQKNFLAHTPAAVLPKATSLRNLNPCGDMMTLPLAIPVSTVSIGQIKIPVLVMAGNQDLVFDSNRVALQSKLFTGSPAVTLRIVNGATHGITVEPTATTIESNLDAWLRRYGF
jgi:pimeloyl-ACP methyl ester carboxylesterase